MESTTMTIRMDRNIKEEAHALFKNLGMDMTTAINVFLRQAIRVHGFPFAVREMPNEETLAAMRESEEIVAHPNKYKSYAMAEELFDAVVAERD